MTPLSLRTPLVNFVRNEKSPLDASASVVRSGGFESAIPGIDFGRDKIYPLTTPQGSPHCY